MSLMTHRKREEKTFKTIFLFSGLFKTNVRSYQRMKCLIYGTCCCDQIIKYAMHVMATRR